MCHKQLASLPHHLSAIHKVKNDEEKKILMSLATGRVAMGLMTPCPIPGCGLQIKRLDRHFYGSHRDLPENETQRFLGEARLSRVRELLNKLRASNPSIPMVSTFDLDPREDVAAPQIERCPTCPKIKKQLHQMRSRCIRLEREIRQLKLKYKVFLPVQLFCLVL